MIDLESRSNFIRRFVILVTHRSCVNILRKLIAHTYEDSAQQACLLKQTCPLADQHPMTGRIWVHLVSESVARAVPPSLFSMVCSSKLHKQLRKGRAFKRRLQPPKHGQPR